MAFLSNKALKALRFKRIGQNVQISEKASIYNPGKISIGDNTRVDDFCILSAGSGGIDIGCYAHISCYASLIGKEKIIIGDFVAISSRASIYSSNDDYSGSFMTNPTVPVKFTNVCHAPVLINKHVIIGSGSIVLPGVTIGMGAAIGSLSLVVKNIDELTINAGIPTRKIKARKEVLLNLEKKLIAEKSHV